jgi:hypothetical protein
MAVDAAASHPWAFVFMLALVLIFGVGRIAKETKTSVQKWTSFVHAWTFSYLALLAILMSVTTDGIGASGRRKGQSASYCHTGFIHLHCRLRRNSTGPRRDPADIVDQAVAATLKKEAGG